MFSKTSTIVCGLCFVLITAPAFAQVRINPNDDLTLRGTTNYNASGVFGLFVKNSTDVSYVEFTLGLTPVTSAKLVLHNDDAGVTAPWTIVVKGAEFDFDETTFTAYNTGSTWPQVGTIPNVMAVAFYEMDLTAWYNANVGRTMSLFLTRSVQPAGSGPIFEDREGTKTGDPVTYGPRLEVVESTLPPCKSLVSPEQKVTATAYRNQAASPSSFPYEITNAGTNQFNYTAIEMRKTVSATADLYNTGVDGSRVVLGDGATDSHWTIISGGMSGTCTDLAPCSTYAVPEAAVPAAWVANDSGSRWISADPTTPNAPPGSHIFRTTFTVAAGEVSTLRIGGRYALDDTLEDVLLNGVSLGISNASAAFAAWWEFTVDHGFVAGTNTLDFKVNNGGAAANATGLRVEFLEAYYAEAGDVTWLSLNKSAGVVASGSSDTVTASIINTDLDGGTHTAFVGISDTCSPAVTHVREIELTIIDCRSAVSPATNSARSFRIGSAQTPGPVSYTFENTGAAPVSYLVTTSGDCSWLQLDKTSPAAPIPFGGSDTVTGTIDPSGLTAGGHVCTLTFTDTCNPAVQHSRDVLLSVDPASGEVEALQQFKAEFETFTGADATAQSPLEACDPGGTTDRSFLVVQSTDYANLPPGWLTQGSIDGTLTTAKFDNPDDGFAGRARFRLFLPFDNTFDPAKGMAVAWNMRIGTDTNARGPIQITFPRVTGPFGTNEESLIPGDVFNVYVRLNDTTIRILNNSGNAIGTIDQYTLATPIAGQYHQWTASACYNAGDQMAYWNLWLEGEKLMFGGTDGSVVGPGNNVFSFRTGLNDVTGDPYIGLGDSNGGEQVWDFEFDWVRMLTYNVSGCPLWDGSGTCAVTIPWPDADDDGDVDQVDFAAFQLCFSGSGVDLSDPATCSRFNRNKGEDNDVDELDLEAFEDCATGPGIPLDVENPPAGCAL